MHKSEIDIITLGCSKNLVDAERVMRRLEVAGYTCVHDSPEPKGEIAIINTCGFIGDAKEESINMILQMAERKKHRQLRQLYVMGCLSQRYMQELTAEIPEVDGWYGKFDYDNLITRLTQPSSLPFREGLGVGFPYRLPLRADNNHTATLHLREDQRGMQPLLLVLRYTAHHRQTHLATDGRDTGRGAMAGQ